MNPPYTCPECGEQHFGRTGSRNCYPYICEVCYPRFQRMILRHSRQHRNNIIHDFSPYEWTRKLGETGGKCPKCHKIVGIDNLTLDHIKPISKVEKHSVYTINDVQPLCQSCNSRKGNRT